MAKAKTLNLAIDELLNNCESVIKEACEYATNKACVEIYKYSMSCLEEYYNNYDPNSYKRTDNLWRAILPYAEKPRQVTNTIISTVGVEYDASVLEGVYYSGSEKYGAVKNEDGHIIKYGHPDSEWVLENYLKGIHPATNGSRNPNDVVYYEIIDAESPYNKMQTYLKTVVPDNFKSSLMTYFIRWMNK